MSASIDFITVGWHDRVKTKIASPYVMCMPDRIKKPSTLLAHSNDGATDICSVDASLPKPIFWTRIRRRGNVACLLILHPISV